MWPAGLKKARYAGIKSERPLFDTEVYVNGEKKYVLPDFIVTARAPDGKTARVVIETMGYEDSDYCARKSRQHTGMKQIGVLHTDPPKWLDNDHPLLRNICTVFLCISGTEIFCGSVL